MRIFLCLTCLAWLSCQRGPPPGWAFADLPGAPPMERGEAARLAQAWRERPTQDATPAHGGPPRYLNRLFLEGSAYLQQHAHNPVNWYPWGPAALAEAKRLNRPILLSVGYATCHWCHVMAMESFEDPEIARFINENFVPIKVDREQRPDVDAMASRALQLLGVQGGWPTTLWLTPEGQPFVGGTYYPPRDGVRGGQRGLLGILQAIAQAHVSDPQRLQGEAQRLQRKMSQPDATGSGTDHDIAAVLQRASDQTRALYDPINGGLRAPRKFPAALPARFLLRQFARKGDAAALTMVGQTLQHMAAGGIHDQIGGGFHRYTVDAQWRVPHFEKMLYDNALLLNVYVEAYQASGEAAFASVAGDIATALLRDFRSPEGGFYAGSDADSADPQGALHEGYFYTWTAAEITQALGPEAPQALQLFHVQTPGPVEGRNVLTPLDSPAAASGRQGPLLDRLWLARSKRPAPHVDDLLVAAWNGLALDALARAALVLHDPQLMAAARALGAFIVGPLQPSGQLVHSQHHGVAGPAAYFADSAACVAGLLSLYELTGELTWLRAAVALDKVGESAWKDGLRPDVRPDLPGFGESAVGSGDLPVPAAASIQASNLHRLSELTEDPAYARRATALTGRLAAAAAVAPTQWADALVALDAELYGSKQICLVAAHDRSELGPLLNALATTFVPARVLNLVIESSADPQAVRTIPALEGKVAQGGKPTAYVCEHRVCLAPQLDPNGLVGQLRRP